MKNKFEKLKIENNDQKINTKKTLDTFDNISAESKRVSKIALNANIIISDLDRQFETATRLKKIDMSFFFFFSEDIPSAKSSVMKAESSKVASEEHMAILVNLPKDKEAWSSSKKKELFLANTSPALKEDPFFTLGDKVLVFFR